MGMSKKLINIGSLDRDHPQSYWDDLQSLSALRVDNRLAHGRICPKTAH
jgi:hypothetical protein